MLTLRRQLLVLALAASLCACARAKFHSKTGAEYTPLVSRAVRCDEGEVQAVLAAGGHPIGTISTRALTVMSTNEDLFDKALQVAGRSGGTHVVLTERGVDAFTVTTPARAERQCVRRGDVEDCQTVFTPQTQTTHEKPTATFVVFRVPPDRWAALPVAVRPGGGR